MIILKNRNYEYVIFESSKTKCPFMTVFVVDAAIVFSADWDFKCV